MSIKLIALCVLFVAWVLKNLFIKWGDYCFESPSFDLIVWDFIAYALTFLYATVRCALGPAIGCALLYIVFF